MKIVITADSSSDIPQELINKFDIKILPYYINYGDESFLDGVEITRAELYKRAETTGVLPQTSAIPPQVFKEFFEENLSGADGLVHFSLSSGLSSACQNAKLAASELENTYVVDTHTLSSAEALSILYAAELAEDGKDALKIATLAQEYANKCDASFVLDSLSYLSKGGRCSSITALGANILGIKPCLEVRDGKLNICKKYKGKMRMVISKYIKERLEEVEHDNERVFLTNSGVSEEVFDAAYNTLKEYGDFNEIILSDAGCVISSHCGPGTLGILFVRK